MAPKGMTLPIDKAFAERFAADWIDSWNAHDLDRVLAHYTEDFEMSSPYIIQMAGEPSGTLRGKAAVGAYWKKALELIPGLKFDLIAVLAGWTASRCITRARAGAWWPRFSISALTERSPGPCALRRLGPRGFLPFARRRTGARIPA
jgi:hypothetical protein